MCLSHGGIARCSHPVFDPRRDPDLVEEANRQRDKQQMLERAGRKIAYLEE